MPDYGMITLQAVVFAVMVVGLVGLFTTVIPGLTIIWVAALVYGFVVGYQWWSIVIMVIMTILMIAGSLADNVLMGASARTSGASWLAIGLSLVGALVGTLVLPPFGGLIGALLMLFVVEIIRLKDWRKALESTGSMVKGCGYAVALRVFIALVMIGMWLLWSFVFQPMTVQTTAWLGMV